MNLFFPLKTMNIKNMFKKLGEKANVPQIDETQFESLKKSEAIKLIVDLKGQIFILNESLNQAKADTQEKIDENQMLQQQSKAL